jgi:PAS domain S-box-containing protein
VTALRQQQEELAEVKARLEEAQRMTRVGSWDWDLVDDLMWWSQELYQLTGQRPGHFEPSWTNFFELVHPDDRPEVRRQLEATLERDAPYWVEFRVVLPDLSERVLRCAARLERFGNGRPRRLIGTCQDVTRLDALHAAHSGRFDAEST